MRRWRQRSRKAGNSINSLFIRAPDFRPEDVPYLHFEEHLQTPLIHVFFMLPSNIELPVEGFRRYVHTSIEVNQTVAKVVSFV